MEVKRKAVAELVARLASPLASGEVQKQAVCELRLLAKWDADNRLAIVEAGAVPVLLHLAGEPSPDPKLQESSVTTLFNLSIHPPNRNLIIATPGSLATIVGVIRDGLLMEARQNSAALLFSLLIDEAFREVVGKADGAIASLLELIRTGSDRAQKDGVRCLFHLSLFHPNRKLIVAAGAIPALFALAGEGDGRGVAEDSLAVLAQVAGCAESVPVFLRISAVSSLAKVLEVGTPKCQENAASALLRFLESGGEAAVADMADVQASCMQSLSNMMREGSRRGKSKANAVIKILLSADQDANDRQSFTTEYSASSLSLR